MTIKNKTISKKIISLFLTLAMLLTMVPAIGLSAFARDRASIKYLNASGKTQTITNYEVLPSEVATSIIIGSNYTGGKWYVVSGNLTYNNRIIVRGTANIILTDKCTLDASAGINVGKGNTLNIYAQSTGEDAGGLQAGTTDYDVRDAGIGGSAGTNGTDRYGIDGTNGQACGTVNIYGGLICARSYGGAGIGGGGAGHAKYARERRPLFYEDSENDRHGGYGGNGGRGGNGGTINIRGSAKVNARSIRGAAIGGGAGGHGGNSSAGNGGNGGHGGNSGNITIRGSANVFAASIYGAGIGGGAGGRGGDGATAEYKCGTGGNGGDGENITIRGYATVEAHSINRGGYREERRGHDIDGGGAGIGGGGGGTYLEDYKAATPVTYGKGGNGGFVNIRGSATVTATSNSSSSIGGGTLIWERREDPVRNTGIDYYEAPIDEIDSRQLEEYPMRPGLPAIITLNATATVQDDDEGGSPVTKVGTWGKTIAKEPKIYIKDTVPDPERPSTPITPFNWFTHLLRNLSCWSWHNCWSNPLWWI